MDMQYEVIDSLSAWTLWHTDRAEKRGMERATDWRHLVALDALLDAVCDLSPGATDCTDADRDAYVSDVGRLYWSARHAADHDTLHGFGGNGALVDQWIEMVESPLSRLTSSYKAIDQLRRADRDGNLSPALVRNIVGAFVAPSAPEGLH